MGPEDVDNRMGKHVSDAVQGAFDTTHSQASEHSLWQMRRMMHDACIGTRCRRARGAAWSTPAAGPWRFCASPTELG